MNQTQPTESQPVRESSVSPTTSDSVPSESIISTEEDQQLQNKKNAALRHAIEQKLAERAKMHANETKDALPSEEQQANEEPQATDEHPADPSVSCEVPQPPKKRIRWPWITLACILFVVIGYLTVAFIPTGPIANLRCLYIQTAMSTADHQWLATMLFPKSVIDKAWVDPSTQQQEIPDEDYFAFLETAASETKPTDTPSANTPTTDPNIETPNTPGTEGNKEPTTHTPAVTADILGLSKLRVGTKDYAGNKVTVVNREEGLFISEFTLKSSFIPGMKYHGFAMLIDDPSRVFIGSTPEKGVNGLRIQRMMEHYGNVVAGINASSFSDPNDEGTGGEIIGTCISDGQAWGRYTTTMASVVLTKEHRLVVGWLPDWSAYTNIRDGMQFGPVLVYKGKNQIDKATGGGMGVQPRTAIGQRADGAIIMIVIDGRVASSIGCTMWEMADMMVKYGAITAGGCDGGSSVVMAYNGKLLNKNSSANPDYGRRIPNAFLVRSKKASK